MRLLRDLTLVALVLAGAIGFSQVPRFVQEYEQRLGGALQEAQRQLDRYETLARQEGLALEGLAQRFAANADSAVAGIGRIVREQTARRDDLRVQAQALAEAGRLAKPIVLLRRHDPEILAAAWAKFAYTLTLDPGFAALGAAAGLLLNALIWWAPFRRRRGLSGAR
jgi:hypothetical protein